MSCRMKFPGVKMYTYIDSHIKNCLVCHPTLSSQALLLQWQKQQLMVTPKHALPTIIASSLVHHMYLGKIRPFTKLHHKIPFFTEGTRQITLKLKNKLKCNPVIHLMASPCVYRTFSLYIFQWICLGILDGGTNQNSFIPS